MKTKHNKSKEKGRGGEGGKKEQIVCYCEFELMRGSGEYHRTKTYQAARARLNAPSTIDHTEHKTKKSHAAYLLVFL